MAKRMDGAYTVIHGKLITGDKYHTAGSQRNGAHASGHRAGTYGAHGLIAAADDYQSALGKPRFFGGLRGDCAYSLA